MDRSSFRMCRNVQSLPRSGSKDLCYSCSVGIALVAIVLGVCVAAAPVVFGSDDPIRVARDLKDASGVQPREISLLRDLWDGVWAIGDSTVLKALDVNTIDEVPDSSWFENRIGMRPMSVDEIAAGPAAQGPAPGPWTVVSGKFGGITPGLQMKDSAGQLYFIKFDPPDAPELASGAEVISTKLLHAAGYHVPENDIIVFERQDLHLAPVALIRRADGRKHPMTQHDLDGLLLKAARRADGRYRAIASKGLPGKPLGPFTYFGVRADDPNDVIPHEHRRELRGLRVFAAWINHWDVKANNSLDTLVPNGNGAAIVKHHLIDFGSTLGSRAVGSADPRNGHEYVLDRRPILLSLFTFGLYVRPWLTIRYPDIPSVGRFEGARFEPDQWKPDFPNRSMLNTRPEDLFWAARRVMAFSNEAIRAVVNTAQYSDPRATDFIVDALVKRRDKIGRDWLASINPLVGFAIDHQSVMTFTNAAVDVTLSTAATAYRIQWFQFDNTGGTVEPIGGIVTAGSQRVPVPDDLRIGAEFIGADVAAIHAQHPAWQRPVRVLFHRIADGWKLVGLERLPISAQASLSQ
jgi:hypothetical protein